MDCLITFPDNSLNAFKSKILLSILLVAIAMLLSLSISCGSGVGDDGQISSEAGSDEGTGGGIDASSGSDSEYDVPVYADRTVFYRSDFEGGEYSLYLRGNEHPGGGSISFLGGELSNGYRPGDGTSYYGDFTNVILDDSPPAMNSIDGSDISLKTHYCGALNPDTNKPYAESFQLNTTIIHFPEVDTVYVRWYQKWDSNWVWPTDQQKLIKVKGSGSSQNFPVTSGQNNIHLTYSPPAPDVGIQVYVYSNFNSEPTAYRRNDSIPENQNFLLDVDRWYCIELMVKSNTPGQQDAEFRYWIDGDLKLGVFDTANRPPTETGGIDHVELQHVVQGGGGADTPTWMDNIEIATDRIGCDVLPNEDI